MIKEEHYAGVARMLAECQAAGRPCLLVTTVDSFDEEGSDISKLQLVSATHSAWETMGMVSTLSADYGPTQCVFVTNLEAGLQ